jgi:hypothetical protein
MALTANYTVHSLTADAAKECIAHIFKKKAAQDLPH